MMKRLGVVIGTVVSTGVVFLIWRITTGLRSGYWEAVRESPEGATVSFAIIVAIVIVVLIWLWPHI